ALPRDARGHRARHRTVTDSVQAKGREDERRPAPEEREAADGRDGAEDADPREGHGVEAPREDEDAGEEEEARDDGRRSLDARDEERCAEDRERVDEVIMRGRLPPLKAEGAVIESLHEARQAVRAERPEGDSEEAEGGSEDNKDS